MPAFFEPADEPAQIALGETLVGIFRRRRAGAEVIAEDLGVDPAVRARVDGAARSARPQGAALGAALGSRRPAADRSAEFPESSVATTGTHDIEPLAATRKGETEEQRAAMLQSLLSAGSCLTLIPLQDVFGWTDRINTPARRGRDNWTWRLPWPVDDVARSPKTAIGARRSQLTAWTREAGR